MNDFIKKTGLFLITSTIVVIGFVIAIHLIIRYCSDFQLKEDYKYIVFGNSHPECAFNDNLIAEFKNLSKSGEGYFYTYHKIKEVISNNKVEAIFLEYSNGSISPTMDKWIWGLEKMNAYFPVHSPFMGKNEILYLYKKNKKDFLKVISTSTRNNLSKILAFDYSVNRRYGGYNFLVRERIKELIENERFVTNNENEEVDISYENVRWLEKIVDYCSSKNIKIYFVRSPQYKYLNRKNERALLDIKNTKFKNVEFLDFDNFPLNDNEYGDFGHLNYKGAEVFSIWFNDLINSGLLKYEDKELFVKKEIEKARTHNTLYK